VDFTDESAFQHFETTLTAHLYIIVKGVKVHLEIVHSFLQIPHARILTCWKPVGTHYARKASWVPQFSMEMQWVQFCNELNRKFFVPDLWNFAVDTGLHMTCSHRYVPIQYSDSIQVWESKFDTLSTLSSQQVWQCWVQLSTFLFLCGSRKYLYPYTMEGKGGVPKTQKILEGRGLDVWFTCTCMYTCSSCPLILYRFKYQSLWKLTIIVKNKLFWGHGSHYFVTSLYDVTLLTEKHCWLA